MDYRPSEGWDATFFFRATAGLFQSFTGVVLIAIFAILLVLVHLGRWRWFLLGCLLYTSSLVFYYAEYFHTDFLPGFQAMVANGRPLSVVLLLILSLPVFVGLEHGSFRSLCRYGLVAFFIFQCFFAVRISIGGLVTRGSLNFVTCMLVFWVAVIGTSQWMRRHRDVANAAWSIAVAGILFCGVTTLHLLTVPRQIMWNNRLISTSGTSTFCAEICAITLIPICYFVAQPRILKIWRLLLGVVAGLLVIYLMWSGTRTGALMAAVGLLLLFRLKIGRWFVAGIVVCCFVWIGLQFFGDALLGASRLLSTEDTRSGTWAFGISEFLSNPVFGKMRSDVQAVENSYITVAARTGIIGVVFFLIIGFQILSGLVQLQRMRKRLGERAMDADLITAGIVALAIGAMLEGYLLATLNVQLTSLFIYLSMMGVLLDPAKADEPALSSHPQELYYDDEYAYANPNTAFE